jgi:hypothetical protein
MIRALIGLLVAAIAAAFIRAVIQMIKKEVTQMVNPEEPQAGAAGPTAQGAAPASSALKKCPVCGTYSPVDRLVSGQYCSAECAAKAS